MPKIIIDGQEIECRSGIPVLQAALEAGMDIPHYCYHPGLKVVASCRLCLMEMKMPHPKTKEMSWAPKLFPSCQTPVRDGMEVRFDSEAVEANVRHVMEYYLLNHPLDCPVCDKAGECYLQDYTEEHGTAASRMVEDKQKNPKKDIGPQTLLYSDRCGAVLAVCAILRRNLRDERAAGRETAAAAMRSMSSLAGRWTTRCRATWSTFARWERCSTRTSCSASASGRCRLPSRSARSTARGRRSSSTTTTTVSTGFGRVSTRRSTSGGSATRLASAGNTFIVKTG